MLNFLNLFYFIVFMAFVSFSWDLDDKLKTEFGFKSGVPMTRIKTPQISAIRGALLPCVCA